MVEVAATVVIEYGVALLLARPVETEEFLAACLIFVVLIIPASEYYFIFQFRIQKAVVLVAAMVQCWEVLEKFLVFSVVGVDSI